MIHLHLAITSALIGLIWTIQIVKYPGFRYVLTENFAAYHDHHARSITWVVLPLMVSELGLVSWLAWENDFTWQHLIPLLLVIGIWASTFLIQVPLHQRLTERKEEADIEKLIRSNWIRTILWTLEGGWFVISSLWGND